MLAESVGLKALLSNSKLQDLPPALSGILDPAPENGILPWLEEISRVVDETMRDDDRLGDILKAAMTLHLLEPHEESKNLEYTRNDLLCIASVYQAALSFYSKGEGIAEQKAEALRGVAMSLVSLGRLSRNDSEARSLLKRAIKIGEEILGAYPEDKYPRERLKAYEIIGSASRQQHARWKNALVPTDHLGREVEALENAIRLSTKMNPTGPDAQLHIALASAVKELSMGLDEPVAIKMLDRTSRYMEEALKNLDRSSEPEHRVKMQEDLGYLLYKLAELEELEDEQASYRSYLASGNAYREALLGMKREVDPVRWARANHGFADALRMQVIRSTNKSEAVPILETSINAYENAVQVFTGEKFPEKFVRIGNEHADALLELGLLSEGTKSRQNLERSIEVMEKAKEYIDSRTCSYELAELKQRLDFALQHLSQHFPDE